MDIVQLYLDYSVDFVTESHKHSRPGWVNTPCPFCTGNPGYHLGYETEGNYFYCWRCGWHPTIQTVATLLHLKEPETRRLLARYGSVTASTPQQSVKVPIRAKEHRMPLGTGPLTVMHKRYLESRKFDAEQLQKTWLLVGTGPIGSLDHIDYKLRILAPVIWENRQVSFQGRDITNKHPLRYITCPKDRELIHHKDILYGKQEDWSETGICCEGITDVWRMGTKAFATFGIKYTPKQVRVMAKTFKRIAVCFDDDPQAIVQANKLVADLRFRGVDAFRVEITGDPGGMKQNDADYLVKQILK